MEAAGGRGPQPQAEPGMGRPMSTVSPWDSLLILGKKKNRSCPLRRGCLTCAVRQRLTSQGLITGYQRLMKDTPRLSGGCDDEAALRGAPPTPWSVEESSRTTLE